MIKISAINIESEEESGSDVEVTKEGLQQIALQQYAKALDLQRKDNLADATQLLKDLLDTELLYDVKEPVKGEKVLDPLVKLKYLCYKNLALMLTEAGDIEGAIEAYTAASDFDDTDITLWHRFGLVCMQGKNYEMALYAFQRGVERNPRHWPCLDKVITLLLALNYNEDCIAYIHDALQLDPGYMRGIIYRQHIYTLYRHMREYMVHLNPIYKWNEENDDPIDKEKALKFLNEAEEIQKIVIEQQKAETFKYMVPNVKLQKAITSFTWESVGESLVHMHHYMTEHCFSHACMIEMIYRENEPEIKMDTSGIVSPIDDNTEKITTETEKNIEIAAEVKNNELSDKDKASDSEKAENDIEMASVEPTENASENKIQKKVSVRRRGSAINSLALWDWCKRKSSRKKQVKGDTIYDVLRKLIPLALVPEVVKKDENQDNQTYTTNLNELFDEKDNKTDAGDYFGTEAEQDEVKTFIDKYTEHKKDIIDMFREYLAILASRWQQVWPENLFKIYTEANKCYNNHIDIPACTEDNQQELIHYVTVNMLAEELTVNEKLNSVSDEAITHDLDVVVSMEIILTNKPTIFRSIQCLEMILRALWLKLHINILNKAHDLALECLYQLLSEFEAMGEHHDDFNLNIINFTSKPNINENKILEMIKIFERNQSLSTVMDLYNQGNYEEVLPIITESFDHCKTIVRVQEEEMPLDFAVQLSVILDTYWALDKVDMCFKWSFTCLHEALKNYFRFTSGSADYDKWTLVIVKILKTIEHILRVEGMSCLEVVTEKELSRGLEDLIRIIGHQVETNASEMPFETVSPWIIMYYILQEEEDQGRSRPVAEKDGAEYCDEIPNPFKVLFIAHEHLGERSWCCNSDAKLLFFILDTIVPRLRSSSLAKCLEQVSLHMEQCVVCLYGHSYKKTKNKHIKDHKVNSITLDWTRAQQLYEIFRPLTLPELTGKVAAIVPDIDTVFLTILSLIPSECDPSKYVPLMEKYIKGLDENLPTVPPLIPYNMKDIYFILGDFYFKKEDHEMSIKYNTLDVVINNDRFASWSQISLAKAYILQNDLKSYKDFKNEGDFLNPAKAIIRCFKRSLDLGSETPYMWIEYGSFVYIVHSFCSRLLKQASESLSMENFEALEKQKEEFLSITHKCFSITEDLNNSDSNKSEDKEYWLLYYMLGKVAEKQNVEPAVYLKFYMKAVKSLQDADAVYPTKINYNTPKHLCMEVLELQYRIHASILKYIEQHENKSIPTHVGKEFLKYIEEWKQVSFTKNLKKNNCSETENETKVEEPQSVQAANILKRSVSDAGEGETHEAKRLKMEAAAAKVRRSASYDTEHNTVIKELPVQDAEQANDAKEEQKVDNLEVVDTDMSISIKETDEPEKSPSDDKPEKPLPETKIEQPLPEDIPSKPLFVDKTEKLVTEDEQVNDKKEDSSSTSSSSSSSDSGSSNSSSDSSSSSSTDTDTSSKSSEDSKPISDKEITKIVSACLDALEDCASRYSPNYKALYRLAHYHYYKRDRDIERCRDIMLSTFTSRTGQKINGFFYERREKNFFNNIWTIKAEEVARAGAFAFHMNRAVLLTFEILKEIDDHKTLLDLSIYLHKVPAIGKKYLRDSDRRDLAKQAFSLSVQSLRGQLIKFSQQADLKTNEIERHALKSLMIDIYKAHNRAQKHLNSKQFANLIVDAYKLICATPIADSVNVMDISIKYCQTLNSSNKHSSNREGNYDKIQQVQRKQSNKSTESSKTIRAATTQSKPDPKPPSSSSSTTSSGLPKLSAHDMAAAFQNYMPMLNDQLLTQQTAAALSYYNNIRALAGYTSLQNSLQTSLQTSLQNTFQAEFYRQFLGQSFSPYNISPPKKQKRGPKPSVPRSAPTVATQMKPAKPYTAPPVTKATPTPVLTSLQKSTSVPLAPSMGTVLSTLPASMTANLSTFGSHGAHSSHTSVPQAHMSTSSVSTSMHSKPPLPHQQVSPGKTLQEKLAERQKSMPSVKSSQDINASLGRLPSSLTITKTTLPKPAVPGKKAEAKKSLSFVEPDVRPQPKPISSDEIIVLDDD